MGSRRTEGQAGEGHKRRTELTLAARRGAFRTLSLTLLVTMSMTMFLALFFLIVLLTLVLTLSCFWLTPGLGTPRLARSQVWGGAEATTYRAGDEVFRVPEPV